MEKLNIYNIPNDLFSLDFEINADISFSEDQLKATIILFVKILSENIAKHSAYLENFQKLVGHDLDYNKNQKYYIQLLKKYSKSTSENVSKIDPNIFCFTEQHNDNAEDLSDFDKVVLELFKSKDEKYSLYKLLYMTILMEKTLSLHKIDFLIRIRTVLCLDINDCIKVSTLIGNKVNDPSFYLPEDNINKNYIFSAALKSMLMNDNKIDSAEHETLENISCELKENELNLEEVKSILHLKSTTLLFDDSENKLTSISEFILKLSNENNILSNNELSPHSSFPKILKEKASIILDTNIEGCSEDLFLKIPEGLRANAVLEYLILVSGQEESQDKNHVLDKVIQHINFNNSTHHEEWTLLLCKAALTSQDKLKNEGLSYRIINHFAQSLNTKYFFHYLIIVNNILTALEPSYHIDNKNIPSLLKTLNMKNVSPQIATSFFSNKEIIASSKRLLLSCLIDELVIDDSTDDNSLAQLAKLCDETLKCETLKKGKEFTLRVIVNSFLLNDLELENMKQLNHLKVARMSKEHQEFFNAITEKLKLSDSKIRRILYHAALDTGILLQFNETLNYCELG
tara:strand:+ start:120106 stop:121821 length:1716 start_codon:yes stop_codon:yes gene_type:complete